jgi:hypothetical protein
LAKTAQAPSGMLLAPGSCAGPTRDLGIETGRQTIFGTKVLESVVESFSCSEKQAGSIVKYQAISLT